MSELKVYEAYICSHEFLPEEAPKDCDAIVSSNSRYEKDDWWDNAKEFKCYIQSEADKEILKLKEENERLKATPEQIMKEVFDKCLIYPKEMVRLDDAYKLAVSLRKQKYKRCLDKANYWLAVSYQCVDDKHRQRAVKHRYKWLEFAKNFKEAK